VNDLDAVGSARVAALCGGVGGAKLAAGLARCLPAERLTVVANTGDDFRRYGLHVSPDIDTVLYTLAGCASRETGWGIAGDTASVMDAVRELAGAVEHQPWFHLGDRDLATHLLRTAWIAQGSSLTDVTRRLAKGYGVAADVLPMTDDATYVTFIETADGEMPFQEWFVRRRCEPPALGLRYGRSGGSRGRAGTVAGAERRQHDMAADDAPGEAAARPTDDVRRAVDDADVVVICPSNPYLSIGPILSLDGVREQLATLRAPVVAVSPIVGGRAIKGPAARMLRDLAAESSSTAVAGLYRDIVDGIVIDGVDAEQAGAIREMGIDAHVTHTIMTDDDSREQLASETLRFGLGLRS
jgi:LPPG:FO 2-phospho-L-lactate transferase